MKREQRTGDAVGSWGEVAVEDSVGEAVHVFAQRQKASQSTLDSGGGSCRLNPGETQSGTAADEDEAAGTPRGGGGCERRRADTEEEGGDVVVKRGRGKREE